MLEFLNYFFFFFHTIFTLFNMVGWAFRETRKLHLVTMLLTCFSWFVMGIWNGWGYCACTEWHWQVREKLGYTEKFDSYIQFLVYKITGKEFDAALVETLTGVIFFICLVLTLIFNFKDKQMKALEKWRDVHGRPLKRRE